jgi:hypothetical protein
MDAFAEANLLNLWELLRGGARALAASTLRAGPAPGAWSDVELSAQQVEVDVEETLCGDPPPGRVVSIEAAVVEGARSASENPPSLAPWIVEPGARLVWILSGSGMADEDLGVLPDDPELRSALRRLCGSPPPPGTGTVLLAVADAVQEHAALRERLARLAPTVVDLGEGTDDLRLTASGGRLRVHTGIRYRRAARTRRPDARARIGAAELAAALEEGRAPALERAGFPAPLAEVLAEAGRVMAGHGAWLTRLRASAAAPPEAAPGERSRA